jgi:hypothetical protein
VREEPVFCFSFHSRGVPALAGLVRLDSSCQVF